MIEEGGVVGSQKKKMQKKCGPSKMQRRTGDDVRHIFCPLQHKQCVNKHTE